MKPILTEKSTEAAKKGKYTFAVLPSMTKFQIEKLVNETFGVHVVKVFTMNYPSSTSISMTRKKSTKKAYKKVIVTLKDKEKIALFGEEEKKKK